MTCAVVYTPRLPSAVFSLHLTISILLQNPAGPCGVQTAGPTAERASPQMTRCCLYRASKAAPAQPPQSPSLPPQSQNLPRRWTSWVWTVPTSAVPQLSPRSPRRPPPPPPQISWGTCSGGHHSQPACRPLPSPHHTKWLPTQPRRALRLRQVGSTRGSQAKSSLFCAAWDA